MKLFPVSLIAAALLASSALAADAPPIISQPHPDSPIGARNPAAPEGLDQFGFVIGDWDVDITFVSSGGASQRYNAKWHNIWIIDGRVVMQEWRGPYVTGAEFRTYDPSTDSWRGYNFYPSAGEWRPTTARVEDGKMVVVITGGSDSDGAFLNRETYYDIAADSFKMKSDRSYDDGKTWRTGAYSMRATRAAPEIGE